MYSMLFHEEFGSRYEEVKLDRVKDDFDESVYTTQDLKVLKQSISSYGLLVPILVHFLEDSGVYKVISGFAKVVAYRQLLAETGDTKYNMVPAKVIQYNCNDIYKARVETCLNHLIQQDICDMQEKRQIINLLLLYNQDRLGVDNIRENYRRVKERTGKDIPEIAQVLRVDKQIKEIYLSDL